MKIWLIKKGQGLAFLNVQDFFGLFIKVVSIIHNDNNLVDTLAKI